MVSTFQKGVRISELSTIGVGGAAKYFKSCKTVDDIIDSLKTAKDEGLPVQVIGRCSNIIFSDDGFDGLVLKIDTKGIRLKEEGDYVHVTVSAGESWDDFVKWSVESGYQGVECLSGIPGTVGASPVQNIGAYGQEVKDVIVSLNAIDRENLELVEFENQHCRFGYRNSIFKSLYKDRYIITSVTFLLKRDGFQEIKYPDLKEYIESKYENIPPDKFLEIVRESVIEIRRGKSMIVDPDDQYSRSLGSFFTNPIISYKEYEELIPKFCNEAAIPSYECEGGIKISAAFLIERAGFCKGLRYGGVGISPNHLLAIVNYSGTSREILEFAENIRNKVAEKFNINLEIEPVIVKVR